MNVQRIRGFLISVPKPSTVRITGEGEPQELKPGKSYAKLAETICALEPSLIECLDTDGKVLRAMRTDTAESQRSDAAAIPAGLASDPNALMLTHFANLLHRAYEHSTEVAFSKMVELADKMNDRSESIEQRLERTEAHNRRLLQEQVDEAFARAEEAAEKAKDEAGGGELVQQMLGGFMSGALTSKPTGKAA